MAESEKREITLADFGGPSPSAAVTSGQRTTSYPQGQEGKAKVTGSSRTSSYQSSIQVDTRGFDSIN